MQMYSSYECAFRLFIVRELHSNTSVTDKLQMCINIRRYKNQARNNESIIKCLVGPRF